MTSIATGQGAVRRMHFAPPTCNQLDHVASSLTGPSLSARVCCLFVNGAFGVWELDSRNELRAVGCLCLFLIAGQVCKVLAGGASACIAVSSVLPRLFYAFSAASCTDACLHLELGHLICLVATHIPFAWNKRVDSSLTCGHVNVGKSVVL